MPHRKLKSTPRSNGNQVLMWTGRPMEFTDRATSRKWSYMTIQGIGANWKGTAFPMMRREKVHEALKIASYSRRDGERPYQDKEISNLVSQLITFGVLAEVFPKEQ